MRQILIPAIALLYSFPVFAQEAPWEMIAFADGTTTIVCKCELSTEIVEVFSEPAFTGKSEKTEKTAFTYTLLLANSKAVAPENSRPEIIWKKKFLSDIRNNSPFKLFNVEYRKSTVYLLYHDKDRFIKLDIIKLDQKKEKQSVSAIKLFETSPDAGPSLIAGKILVSAKGIFVSTERTDGIQLWRVEAGAAVKVWEFDDAR